MGNGVRLLVRILGGKVQFVGPWRMKDDIKVELNEDITVYS
jgi:hypothetical protein